MEDDTQARVIAEQITHTVDLLRFQLDAMRAEQSHIKQMSDHRLSELEECTRDHEARIRTIQEDVTRGKTAHNLAAGGSTFISLVALLRTSNLILSKKKCKKKGEDGWVTLSFERMITVR